MRNRNLTTRLIVRLAERDYDLLRQVSAQRREDVSGFVRRAIASELARLSYLPSDEKKALGIVH